MKLEANSCPIILSLRVLVAGAPQRPKVDCRSRSPLAVVISKSRLQTGLDVDSAHSRHPLDTSIKRRHLNNLSLRHVHPRLCIWCFPCRDSRQVRVLSHVIAPIKLGALTCPFGSPPTNSCHLLPKTLAPSRRAVHPQQLERKNGKLPTSGRSNFCAAGVGGDEQQFVRCRGSKSRLGVRGEQDGVGCGWSRGSQANHVSFQVIMMESPLVLLCEVAHTPDL